MGIQINGNTDNISAVDGGLTVSDLELNQTGVSTFHSHLHVADQIIHLDDANSKIRFPAADTISLETAGSERLRVASTGNVSIGNNATPDTLLHLQGDKPKLRVESTNTLEASAGTEEIGRIEFEGTKGSNRNVAASLRVRQDGTWSTVDDWFSPTAIEFYTQDQSGTEITTPRFTITSEGNVIIAESIAVNRPRIVLSAPNDGTNYRHLFGANLQVNSSGTFTTPTQNISGGGWEYLPANSLNDHGNLRYLSAPDTNATSSTPLERLRITSGGEVLIGTTTDANVKLDVEGSLRAKAANYVAPASGTGLEIYYANSALNDAPSGYLLCYDRSSSAYKKINYDASEHKFRTSGTERLSITSTGAIVSGILTATQFKVTTGANAFETSANVLKGASGQKGVYLRSSLSSATTPSYSSVDDTNTGIFLPGSDVFAVTTGGTERLRINSSGETLVKGDSNPCLSVDRGSANTTNINIKYNGSVRAQMSAASNGFEISAVGSTAPIQFFANGSERVRIDSSGSVIIGDTSTTNASGNANGLVVSKNGQAGITIVSTNSAYSNLFFSDGSSGSAPYVGYVQYNHSGNRLNLGVGGAGRAIIYDKAGSTGTNHSVFQLGGGFSNNHYNNISNASITFGGGNDIENYFLGVRRENYGGDYTKLDLRWHTGIRMGAQQIYGGIRFFNDEDLDSLKFSIMGGGDHVEAHTTFRPGANNTYNCGTSGRRWAQIWYYNANSTSDRNEKNTIKESDLGLDFICKLKPVSYKWNQREGENADTKTHYGLISQDVEEAVIGSKKTLDDFGAIVKPEGDDPMGLSYHEFISPLVKAIQEQQEQIKILQEKIASLEGS